MERFELNREFAVTYFEGPITPLRPLRAVYVGDRGNIPFFEVHDPDDPLDFPIEVGHHMLVVHGLWTDPCGSPPRTWAQFAAEQYGHVLRQRHLVERLAKIGIKRDPEPYIHKDRISNAVELSLILNYDEIDLLLRRGGV